MARTISQSVKNLTKGNVLAIGSHPDDIEFGCGGALCRFAQEHYTVYLLILTPGGKGGDPAVRREEQLKSAKILGVQEVFWGLFEDTKLPFYENVISEIESVVEKTRPSIVFVHHGKDTHQDHRHVSTCAVAATRNVRNVLFYEGPTSFNFEPNVFVDIDGELEKKIGALMCHGSQIMRTNIDGRSITDIARATATFRGTQSRVAHAEAFLSLRMFLL
jgi:LmbE family N-acetylglucosaminyl deacetylase